MTDTTVNDLMRDSTKTSAHPRVERRPLGRNGLRKYWRKLASMRFALLLLIVLAVASVIAVACGEFWPVTGLADPKAYYSEHLSSLGYSMAWFFGVLHPYSSFWYLGLLMLLALSLTACVSTRLLRIVKMAFLVQPFRSPLELQGLKVRETVKASTELTRDDVTALLKDRGYTTKSSDVSGHDFHIAGSKFGFGRLGAVLNHVGLLSLFLGGLWMAIFSSRTFLWIPEGTSALSPDGSYTVVVDSFEVTTNPNGQISDYLSYIRVLDNDEELLSKVAEVNHPLRFGAYSWYQSSYQLLHDRVAAISLSLPITDSGRVRIAHGDTVKVSSQPERSLYFARFVPHFKEHHGTVVSASDEFVDPAVNVIILDEGKAPLSTWIRVKQPQVVRGATGPSPFLLDAVEPAYATGLDVRSFPGAIWIWVGFSVMSLGLVVSFLFDHRRIWIFAKSDNGQTVLEVGGDIMHALATFRREIEQTMDTVRPTDSRKGVTP